MTGLQIRTDTSAIVKAAAALTSGKKNIPAAVARALNRTQDGAKTQMVRALTVQTGLKRKTIVAALRSSKKASAGSLFAVLGTHGGDIRLKFFGPKETTGGVSAAPWGNRRVFARTFIHGGRFPNRKGGPFNQNGHVYVRSGKGRWPLKVARSGLFIPKEMVTGRSEDAFLAAVASILPKRLEHEIGRALVGGS